MNRFATCILLMIAMTACGVPASENPSQPASDNYSIHYTISLTPDRQSVQVDMTLKQSGGQLREYTFTNPGQHFGELAADGRLESSSDHISWQPDADGGDMQWQVQPSLQRNGKGYDALMTPNWAIFRAEDIIPRARTRSLAGTSGVTTMSFDLPSDWSSVSEYKSGDEQISVERPERRFDQPVGWIAIGDLGIRRESIAGTQITIAAPRGENVRRLDMLALLNWTLPELADIQDQELPRLTVVSAGNPMWRGGLSAPASMFIHADRPLISENGTSTLMHELVHIAFDIHADSDSDWIVEGLAEYYSIELLRRGSAITKRRYEQAIKRQEEWAEQAEYLCGEASSGPVTARALTVFHALNKEIKSRTKNKMDLDDLVRKLSVQTQEVSLTTLRELANDMMSGDADSLRNANLDGCDE